MPVARLLAWSPALRRLTAPVPVLLAPVLVLALTAGPAAASGAPGHGTRPAAPTGVRVPALAYDESSVTLVWEKPRDHAGIVDYRVYLNGRRLGLASDASTSPAKPYLDRFYADPANAAQVRAVMDTFTATGLAPHTRYRFTVRSVDSAGRESADSAPVTQSTTPAPRVFDVTDYGAVGDGTTVDTAAIQRAIDACTPGGKVLIPAGVFKSGAIWLHSDMTLQVAAGATLLGSDTPADYPYNYLLYDYSTDPRFYSLINAHTYDYGSLRDIRVVGPGTIDGNGWKQAGPDPDGFPVALPSSSSTVGTNGILAKAQVAAAAALGSASTYATRSNLITMRGVTNVYYGGFTAVNPAQHTLVNLHSDNVTVNGVRLLTEGVNNADGVEFTHGNGLTVINNVFDTGDDDMNFAAGLGAAAPNDPPTRNAWIADNYFRKGHGAVVLGSHTGAWIEDIVAEDNVIDGTDVGLRMKTDPNNGGGGRDVLFRDNAIRSVTAQAFIFTSAYSDPNAAIVVEPSATKAQFRDVRVEHVTVDGTGSQSISVIGVPDRYHQGLHFTDVEFLHANPASIAYLRDSTFTGVVFDNTPNPWVITNSTGLTFRGGSTATPVSVDASAGPAWPRGATLTASATATTATLSWPAASDDTAVAGYLIRSGSTTLAQVPGGTRSTTVTGLSPALRYDLTVRAVDATGNTADGPTARVTTGGAPDAGAPQAPAGAAVTLVPGGLGTTWARVSWPAATDTYGVDHYAVAVDGRPATTAPGTATGVTVTRLRPGTPYTVTVAAVDASGNTTSYPAGLTVTTNPPYDTGIPAWAPGDRLRARRTGSTSVALAWPTAHDARGVAGYRVYLDGRPVPTGAVFTPVSTASTVTGTGLVLTGLAPGRHTVTVQAGDPSGRWTGRGLSVTLPPAH
ncbi:fibronectin type III domain-containing protein [Rugosimonospora africana]|uniref:fibronectin type III domain-containing protein n=1 Tax=Rugosimonospora africana TaxID=556532 RepID=UPI001944909A|nr:fibronectin type III domain-containing protein [Rugosimonospora africana]